MSGRKAILKTALKHSWGHMFETKLQPYLLLFLTLFEHKGLGQTFALLFSIIDQIFIAHSNVAYFYQFLFLTLVIY